MDAALAMPTTTRETREFVERGCGLPQFIIGHEFEVNGVRCVVVRVVSQLTKPESVVVEVEAVA